MNLFYLIIQRIKTSCSYIKIKNTDLNIFGQTVLALRRASENFKTYWRTVILVVFKTNKTIISRKIRESPGFDEDNTDSQEVLDDVIIRVAAREYLDTVKVGFHFYQIRIRFKNYV